MKWYSKILGLVSIAAMAVACGSSTEVPGEPENVGEVSQGLVIDQTSPVVDSYGMGSTPQYWTAAVGPVGASDPNEPNDSPGVCGFVMVSGGFTGFDPVVSGYHDVKPSIRIGVTGNYGSKRYLLIVRGNTYGNGSPRAKIHCVSASKFTNTPSIKGADVYGPQYVWYDQYGQHVGQDPWVVVHSGGGAISVQYSDPAPFNNLNIWGGAAGFIGNSSTTAPGKFVSKFFRSTNSFTGEIPGSVSQRIYAYNDSVNPCVISGGNPDRCVTETYGMTHQRLGGANWTRAFTDNPAEVTNGVSATRTLDRPLPQMFCFISGLAGAWEDRNNTAEIVANNFCGIGTGACTDLRVSGAKAAAAVSCVWYAQ